MSRRVRITRPYVDDIVTALPLRFLEFLDNAHPVIVAEAQDAFSRPRPPAVDPDYDVVELVGRWEGGGCEYVAVAQQRNDGVVDLIAVAIDLDPLPLIP